MKTTWKFPLVMDDRQVIRMPKGAHVLSAQMQFERLCAWAVVDNTVTEQVDVEFRVAGTGHPLDDMDESWYFLSTVQMLDGGLVFHVFMRMS